MRHAQLWEKVDVKTGLLMVVIIVELSIVIFGELGGVSFISMSRSTASSTNQITPLPAPAADKEAPPPEEVQYPHPVADGLFEYAVVKDSCGAHFESECVRVRSGPGTDHPVVSRVRNDMVLKVGEKVQVDGQTWYNIVFDEWLRFPERMEADWYIAAEFLDIIIMEGDTTVWEDKPATTTKKQIIVDRSEQTLTALENDNLFMETSISTGLELTPTPRGVFRVFKKTPSRYMQGPLPGLADQQEYDLPGVPWNMYFTEGGAVIHGAYWHTSFGSPYSHGCVNMEPGEARRLYEWAELGTTVVVRD